MVTSNQVLTDQQQGKQPEQPKKTRLERFSEYRQQNVAARPKLLAEATSAVRHIANDIRGTFHQVVFGVPEGTMGVGTAMNPTPIEVTQARGTVQLGMNAEVGVFGRTQQNKGKGKGR